MFVWFVWFVVKFPDGAAGTAPKEMTPDGRATMLPKTPREADGGSA